MKSLNTSSSRRKFFRTSSFAIGSIVLPKFTAWVDAQVGYSLALKIQHERKSLGLKFTIIDQKYIIATVRVPGGKKMGHFYISPKSANQPKTISKSKYSFALKKGGKEVLFIDTKTGAINTSLRGVDLTGVHYQNGHEDTASGQGFWSWLGDLVNDIATGIASQLTLITGDEGTFKYSNGGTTTVRPGAMTYDNGYSGFIAEPGLEEQPGVWY